MQRIATPFPGRVWLGAEDMPKDDRKATMGNNYRMRR